MSKIKSLLNLESERKIFNISLIVLLTFIGLHIISYYRSIFGVIEGYAPYEFGFNILFFLPGLLFITILALIVSLKVKSKWSNYKNKKLKWFTLVVISPIILFWIYSFLRIILILVSNPYN
jgi:hypothetical protein